MTDSAAGNEEATLRGQFDVPDSVKLGRNDLGWLRVFAAGFGQQLDESGYFEITAAQLKQLSRREPRLMAKHDFSTSRPWIFQQLGLAILPLSRERYLVGRFNLYERLPEPDSPVRVREIPAGITSLDFSDLSSEALALAAASLSGIIEDFAGTGALVATVSGRMSTRGLTMCLPGLSGAMPITNAQMEIDAGFESDTAIVLVEAKNRLPENFNIRQIYFPFRRFQQQLDKQVIPIYLAYSNEVFHLYRYKFANPADFRSITLVDSARYQLSPSLVDARTLSEVVCTTEVAPTNVTFPQADSLARVISLCEQLAQQTQAMMSKEEVATHFGFTARQASYYSSAAMFLGLVDVEHTTVRLNSTGQAVLASPVSNVEIIRLLAARPIFHQVLGHLADAGSVPAKADIVALMSHAGLQLGASTIARRAATVQAWAGWVWDVVFNRQLDLGASRR